jgi:hypothetical protein
LIYLISFVAIFQLLNTTQTIVSPVVSMTMGNNTLWLANEAVNVTTISYNTTVRRNSLFSFEFISNFLRTQLNPVFNYLMKLTVQLTHHH